MSNDHGRQFDADRFTDAQSTEELVVAAIDECLEPHHIIGLEGEVYDNYAEEKTIDQLLDYAGIDYVVDLWDEVIGINHRTHTPTDSKLRFDLRRDTGTKAESELDKLEQAIESDGFLIAPKYATRMKLSKDGGIEWFRVVNLKPLAGAVSNGLDLHDTWTDKNNDVVAWMWDYELLENWGLIEAEVSSNNE